jgi:hypothetical protein
MNEASRDIKSKNDNDKKSPSDSTKVPISSPVQNPPQHNPYIFIDNEITTSDPFFMFNSKQEL